MYNNFTKLIQWPKKGTTSPKEMESPKETETSSPSINPTNIRKRGLDHMVTDVDVGRQSPRLLDQTDHYNTPVKSKTRKRAKKETKKATREDENYIMERFNNPLFSIHQIPIQTIGPNDFKKLRELCELYDKKYSVFIYV